LVLWDPKDHKDYGDPWDPQEEKEKKGIPAVSDLRDQGGLLVLKAFGDHKVFEVM
jgi:hypothetical protein